MKALVGTLRVRYKEAPPDVRRFIKWGVILFISWQVLYHALLQPLRIPDAWLTRATARATAAVWSFTEQDMSVRLGSPMDYVLLQGVPIVGIADGCNALEVYLLYLGFLACYPIRSVFRVLVAAIGGVLGIATLNVLRCAGVGWLNIHRPGWVDFAHHYLFTLALFSFVLFLWHLYVREPTHLQRRT